MAGSRRDLVLLGIIISNWRNITEQAMCAGDKHNAQLLRNCVLLIQYFNTSITETKQRSFLPVSEEQSATEISCIPRICNNGNRTRKTKFVPLQI